MATKSKFAQAVPPVAAKKTVVKPVAAKPVAAEPAQATHATPEPQLTEQRLLDKLRMSWDEYTSYVGAPSWKRQAASVALGLITYGGVFYVGIQLLDALMFALMAYSGVGFISFMVAFLGIVLALIAATTAGMKVYEFAMAFEASRVRARFNSWTDAARAKFIRTSPSEVSHA